MPDVVTGISAEAEGTGWTNRQLWVTFGLCVVAPLSFFESMDRLAFTSMLSLGFVAFLTGMVFVFAVAPLDACGDDVDECQGNEQAFIFNMDTVKVLTVFIFGYTCQQNVFAITNEIATPTRERVDSVIGFSIGLAICVYVIVAVSGYATFGDAVESDILVNYGTGPAVTIARLFVAMLVCFSYPLQCHPSRMCTTSIVKLIFPGATVRHKFKVHLLITAVFLTCSYLVALTVTDLGVVLAIVRATGSTMVSYVLPGVCYFRIFKERHLKDTWQGHRAGWAAGTSRWPPYEFCRVSHGGNPHPPGNLG
eukprot:FR734582.1.p1 GENE.FR734582.1~~FR734582.1.p1  ORF type:complete len:346 (+),score=50.95 FR734582.1:117-1040(+)